MGWESILIESAPNPRLAEHVAAALNDLLLQDADIFATDVNERTLAHRLAVYLERRLPGFHVDCEYNRDGHVPKRLYSMTEETTSADTEGTTIFPDIIVHRRGTAGPNILAIELKKTTNGRSAEWDVTKLTAMRR